MLLSEILREKNDNVLSSLVEKSTEKNPRVVLIRELEGWKKISKKRQMSARLQRVRVP